MAQSVFATRNADLARRLVEVKEDVRRLEKQSSERHLQRLRDGLTDSIQTSSVHLDMLRDLKRINAHIAAVAHLPSPPPADGQGRHCGWRKRIAPCGYCRA
ncbi:PhoU domain-containing protein [Agrobacterium tumefaciens]|uniref:PhoU domain-containing protein n=1 Tax=Agrobacterium tumefaciens TaxID=358 RepID=UPI003AF4159E